MQAFLKYPSRFDHDAYAQMIYDRVSVATNIDAIFAIYWAAWRSRYSWTFGRDHHATRSALISSFSAINASQPLVGASLGPFFFDMHRDVQINIDQLALLDGRLITVLSRSNYSGPPTLADYMAVNQSGFMGLVDCGCQAPPPVVLVSSTSSPPASIFTAKDDKPALLGVLLSVILLAMAAMIFVGARKVERRNRPRKDLASSLQKQHSPSVWIPPSLPPSALRLGQRIGEGSYGAVYLADLVQRPGPMLRYHANSGTIRESRLAGLRPPAPLLPPQIDLKRCSRTRPIQVAVKQLKFLPNRSDSNSLIREALLLAKLQGQPYIVQVLGLTLGDRQAITLERCVYGSLEHMLRYAFLHDRQLTWALKLRMASQVARAVAAMHAQHLLHNDVAARNILVTYGLDCKLSDFGLARDVRQLRSAAEQPRLPVRWTSPEALTGDLTQANDVWSLGVLLWEMAANCTAIPYSDLTDASVVAAVVNGVRLIPPSQTPTDWIELLRRLWRAQPQRPAAADVVLQLFRMRDAEALREAGNEPADGGAQTMAATGPDENMFPSQLLSKNADRVPDKDTGSCSQLGELGALGQAPAAPCPRRHRVAMISSLSVLHAAVKSYLQHSDQSSDRPTASADTAVAAAAVPLVGAAGVTTQQLQSASRTIDPILRSRAKHGGQETDASSSDEEAEMGAVNSAGEETNIQTVLEGYFVDSDDEGTNDWRQRAYLPEQSAKAAANLNLDELQPHSQHWGREGLHPSLFAAESEQSELHHEDQQALDHTVSETFSTSSALERSAQGAGLRDVHAEAPLHRAALPQARRRTPSVGVFARLAPTPTGYTSVLDMSRRRSSSSRQAAMDAESAVDASPASASASTADGGVPSTKQLPSPPAIATTHSHEQPPSVASSSVGPESNHRPLAIASGLSSSEFVPVAAHLRWESEI